MTSRAWLAPALAGILGLAAGLWIAGGQDSGTVESPPATERTRGPAAGAAAGVAGTGIFTLEDVRRVVREELDRRGGARPSAAGDASAANPGRDPPTPAQVSKALQAQAVLDSAIAKRTWTDQDSDAMREHFDALAPDQQAALLEAYAAAINRGRLVPQTDRAPF